MIYDLNKVQSISLRNEFCVVLNFILLKMDPFILRYIVLYIALCLFKVVNFKFFLSHFFVLFCPVACTCNGRRLSKFFKTY